MSETKLNQSNGSALDQRKTMGNRCGSYSCVTGPADCPYHSNPERDKCFCSLYKTKEGKPRALRGLNDSGLNRRLRECLDDSMPNSDMTREERVEST